MFRFNILTGSLLGAACAAAALLFANNKRTQLVVVTALLQRWGMMFNAKAVCWVVSHVVQVASVICIFRGCGAMTSYNKSEMMMACIKYAGLFVT